MTADALWVTVHVGNMQFSTTIMHYITTTVSNKTFGLHLSFLRAAREYKRISLRQDRLHRQRTNASLV